MIFFETIAVAFGMFSALPLPQPEWTPRNMRYALCAFPLVGLICGAAWWGWALLCDWLGFPLLLRAAGFCLAPVLISGGIHLDGYADTCDARASYAGPEKKREILADPHCGAFAVIRVCVYFVAYFGLCGTIEPTARACACTAACFVLERALSGLAVASFPLAKDTGLAHTFATAADRVRVRRVLTVLAVIVCAVLILCGGVLAAAAALLVFAHYRRVAVKQFGGLSGDLAGWFLQRAELWMLAGVAAGQILGRCLGWS